MNLLNKTHHKTESFKQANTQGGVVFASFPAKLLRMILVFTLAFFSTWHLQYSYAYGDETDDTTTEDTTGGDGTGGEGEGDETGGNTGGTEGGGAEGGNSGGTDGTDPVDPDPPAPAQYTVNFYSDGTLIDTKTIQEGNYVASPENPTKEGWTFKGWLLEDTRFDFTTPVTGDLNLNASWEENVVPKYIVTFSNDDGNRLSEIEVEENGIVTPPENNPTKDRYVFKNWLLGGTPFDFATPITGDITLTAEWEELKIISSYIEDLEILGERTAEEDAEDFDVKTIPAFDGQIDGKEKRQYQLRARLTIKDILEDNSEYVAKNSPVIVGNSSETDSLEEMKVEKTPASEGVDASYFADLEWKLDSAENEKGESVLGDETLIKLDEKTGLLEISPGIRAKISCTTKDSKDGEPITKELTAEMPKDVETVDIVTITYDANGGSGNMETSVSEAGNIIIRDNDFEAPKSITNINSNDTASSDNANTSNSDNPKKQTEIKFSSWNTKEDGTGTSFEPGQSSIAPLIAALQELSTDKTAGSETGETTSSDAAEAQTKKYTLTLYAQWNEVEDKEEDLEGEEFDGKPRLVIKYNPVPKGQEAVLKPVIYGLENISFTYVWERKPKDGDWATYVPDDITKINVLTDDSTIGTQYRVSMWANRVIDDDSVLTSEPVTITEGTDFIQLSFKPVVQGESTDLKITASQEYNDGTFKWYESSDNGASWQRIKDASGKTYRVEANDTNLGKMYRVIAESKDKKQTAEDSITLVALDPDADPIDTTTPIGKDGNTGNNSGNSGSSSSSSSSNAPGNENNRQNDDTGGPGPAELEEAGLDSDPANEIEDDYGPGAGDETDDTESNDEAPDGEYYDATDELDDEYGPWIDEDDPAELEPEDTTPTPEPVNVVPSENITSMEKLDESNDFNIITDPEVTQKIKDAEAAQPKELGQTWRELSVMPKPEEIQKVLDSNPFAPYIIPFVVAFLACGMVERLVSFRRQTQESNVSFA